MTTATALFSPETGRSHLQESLFAWREPEAQPASEVPSVARTLPESDLDRMHGRRHPERHGPRPHKPIVRPLPSPAGS
ncbi:hypothetical protein ACIQU3_36720 [Streptomyces sp. NPDC101110]|uniref:hypothetical protein n=1 Tax=Streptomyces sp. NPDC101110 TaxID=3366104 RepID=UPI0038110237